MYNDITEARGALNDSSVKFCKRTLTSSLPLVIWYMQIHTQHSGAANHTRSVRKVSGLPLYLRAIVFERLLWDMNVISKASRTYRLLADICRTYSLCAECLCLQSYFWVRRILWLLKMTEKQDQRICIKFCFQLGKTSSKTMQMMPKAVGNECMSKTRIIVSKEAALLFIVILVLADLRRQKHWIILSECDLRLKVIVD